MAITAIHTKEDLAELQALPLELKIKLTQRRIREWYQYFGGQVCVSFSGGKDSTVLLDIVRGIYPDVPAVFSDTGLEYPEIKEFVKTKENVEIVRPKINFRQVIETYGYPLVSKEVAEAIHYARRILPEERSQTVQVERERTAERKRMELLCKRTDDSCKEATAWDREEMIATSCVSVGGCQRKPDSYQTDDAQRAIQRKGRNERVYSETYRRRSDITGTRGGGEEPRTTDERIYAGNGRCQRRETGVTQEKELPG